jgi:hypothetical protein
MKRKLPILLVLAVFVLAATGAFAADALKIKVKVPLANVRRAADMTATVVVQLPQGTVLDVVEKIGDWYRVSLNITGTQVAGFLHNSVVEETAETVPPAEKPVPPPVRPVARPEAPAPAPQRPPAPAPAAAASAGPKFFVAVGYQMGFGTDSRTGTATETLYQETAAYDFAYQLKKGNAIDAAVGYYVGPSFGVKLGGSLISRDFAETTSFAVPHPLWMGTDNYRVGEITGTGMAVKQTELYLNLFYALKLGPVDAEFYGGPCFVLSTATIVAVIANTETGYPYTSNTVTQTTADFKSNAFGFDAGLNLGIRFGSSFGVYLDGRYVSATATYKPGGIFPDLPAALGGFRAGGGLKLMF